MDNAVVIALLVQLFICMPGKIFKCIFHLVTMAHHWWWVCVDPERAARTSVSSDS